MAQLRIGSSVSRRSVLSSSALLPFIHAHPPLTITSCFSFLSAKDRRATRAMREYEVVVLGGEHVATLRCYSRAHRHLLCEAGGVGKSALTVRFVNDAWLEHYNPTIEGAKHVCVCLLRCSSGCTEQYRRDLVINGEHIAVSPSSVLSSHLFMPTSSRFSIQPAPSSSHS